MHGFLRMYWAKKAESEAEDGLEGPKDEGRRTFFGHATEAFLFGATNAEDEGNGSNLVGWSGFSWTL